MTTLYPTTSTQTYVPNVQPSAPPMTDDDVKNLLKNVDTENLIKQAEKVADSILNKKPAVRQQQNSTTTTTAPVYVDLTDKSTRINIGNRTDNRSNQSSSGNQERNETLLKVALAILGIVGLLGTAYSIARTQGDLTDANIAFSNFNQTVDNWVKSKGPSAAPDYSSLPIVRISVSVSKIFSRNQEDLKKRRALLALGFVASGIVVAGVVVSSTHVIGIGILLGLSAAIGGMYRLGDRSVTRLNESDAQAIRKNIEEFRGSQVKS